MPYMDPIGWNLKISHWKRRFLVKTHDFLLSMSIFRGGGRPPTLALTAVVTYNLSSIKTSAYDASK